MAEEITQVVNTVFVPHVGDEGTRTAVPDHLKGNTDIKNRSSISTEDVINGLAITNLHQKVDVAMAQHDARRLEVFLAADDNASTAGGTGTASSVDSVNGEFRKADAATYEKFKNEWLRIDKEKGWNFQDGASRVSVEKDLVSLCMLQFDLYLKVAKVSPKGSSGHTVMTHTNQINGSSTTSRHKMGVAIDISWVNGTRIEKNHKDIRALADALARICTKESNMSVHEMLCPSNFVTMMHERGFKSASTNGDHGDHLHFSVPRKYGLKGNGYSAQETSYNSKHDPGMGEDFYMSWIFDNFDHYCDIRDGKVDVSSVNGVSAASGTPMDITNGTAITEAELKKLLGKINGGDRIKSYAGQISKYGAKFGVNPLFSIAQSAYETGWWTSTAFKNSNNIGGLSKADHMYKDSGISSIKATTSYQKSSRWAVFENPGDSFQAKQWLIARHGYFNEGRTTIRKVIEKYAPAVENNVGAYVDIVDKNMRDFCKKLDIDPDKKRSSKTSSSGTQSRNYTER